MWSMWDVLRQSSPIPGWRRYTHPKTKVLHVTPSRPCDTMYHRYNIDCPCDPIVEEHRGDVVMIHQAADGRGPFPARYPKGTIVAKDLIAEYHAIREALADELYQLNQTLPAMLERREQLLAIFRGEEQEENEAETDFAAFESLEDALIDFLRRNPDSSRPEINAFFKGVLAPENVSKLIGNMSKRKVIVNNGTKRNSQWSLAHS